MPVEPGAALLILAPPAAAVRRGWAEKAGEQLTLVRVVERPIEVVGKLKALLVAAHVVVDDGAQRLERQRTPAQLRALRVLEVLHRAHRSLERGAWVDGGT